MSWLRGLMHDVGRPATAALAVDLKQKQVTMRHSDVTSRAGGDDPVRRRGSLRKESLLVGDGVESTSVPMFRSRARFRDIASGATHAHPT